MLSGFSSYFFGGNAEGDQEVTQDDSVASTTASADATDWVFVESPGKGWFFTIFCCGFTIVRWLSGLDDRISLQKLCF